jgi:septum formation protein
MSKRLILASGSERRKQIFDSLGLKYEIIIPNIDETGEYINRPSYLVKQLASQKAYEVSEIEKEGVIIAADTIVLCNEHILGKPSSPREAEKFLKMLTSNHHYVYTGIAIIDMYENKSYLDSDKTYVSMNKISKDEIKILARKNLDKAGAYSVQDNNDPLVKTIKGDYFNVVGLPLEKTVNLLKKCGVEVDEKAYKKLLNSHRFAQQQTLSQNKSSKELELEIVNK